MFCWLKFVSAQKLKLFVNLGIPLNKATLLINFCSTLSQSLELIVFYYKVYMMSQVARSFMTMKTILNVATLGRSDTQ